MRMQLSYLGLIFSILCSFLLLCNCSSEDRGSIEGKIAEIKKTHKTKVEDLPELKIYAPVTYNSESLQDPFEPPVNEELIKKRKKLQELLLAKRPDEGRKVEYLENHSLDTLIMVGTLEKKGTMWALIADKNGKLYKVQKGNYLGRNSGKIVNITEKKIEIDEIVFDAEIGWKNRKAYLLLKKQTNH
jgi:type IV pilus assembly protein PilP